MGDILLTGGLRHIEVQNGDQNIQLDDANPLWNGQTYGSVTRFFGDGVLAGSKLEAGGLQLERRIQIRGGAPGVGKVLTSDAVGNATWETPTVGDITGVTAGDGLTGGGTAGNVTLNVVAINGLTDNANDIRLGGALIQNTTITQDNFGMTYNLTGSGDFTVQDAGINHFQVADNGLSFFGDDVFWRDGSTAGTNLMILSDDGNDGRLRIYENGVTSVDLDANTQFIFNEQGLDRDFRVESDVNPNAFRVDAGNDRVGVGIGAPLEDLHVYRGDNDVARVYATGTTQGSGMFYAGQSGTFGGGFVYDGDGAPALVGGTDRITFFRRNNNTDVDVMSFAYNSSVVRVSSLAGAGNRMVIANANGDLFTQAIPANGDITAVNAGIGLTGGGTAGTVTLNAAANNGLYVNAGADRIRLGGALLENTTITNPIYQMVFNLSNTGDFHIQDNGTNHFSAFDNGDVAFGGDVYWRDENTGGTILGQMIDDGNDGRFRIFENGVTSVDLDANTQFIFNEQGLDRNFRAESDGNANMFFLDAGLNRVSVGTATSAGTFNVLGNSYHSDDIYLRDGAVNGGDILVRIYDSVDDGIIDVYEDNGMNHRIHGNGTSVFNEQGNNNANVRMESDTRVNMFYMDAPDNLVRIGNDLNGDTGNGSVVNGVTVDYVADFDNGVGATGTAIGIGSVEYLLDLSSETAINNRFSPTRDNIYDLGSATLRWDDVYATNGTIVTSDEREKMSIQPMNYGLSEIMKLRPVTYKWKRDQIGSTVLTDSDKELKLGLIAQEVQQILPEVVQTHDWKVKSEEQPDVYTREPMDRLGMSYHEITPVLIKAIQEQQAQIEALKAEINALKR